MHRLKGNYLRSGGVGLLQQLVKVADIVVTEDELPRRAVPHTLDDGGVVASVGVDLTTLGSRGEKRPLLSLQSTCTQKQKKTPEL